MSHDLWATREDPARNKIEDQQQRELSEIAAAAAAADWCQRWHERHQGLLGWAAEVQLLTQTHTHMHKAGVDK